MEGYTARDALIVMRMDLTESLHEVQQQLSDLDETLEFCGIARQILTDDPSLTAFPAIRRWLEIVSNETDLEQDREDLLTERDDLVSALEHLEERLTGKSG